MSHSLWLEFRKDETKDLKLCLKCISDGSSILLQKKSFCCECMLQKSNISIPIICNYVTVLMKNKRIIIKDLPELWIVLDGSE